ncbi:unnamed protein product [Triticum turgidum subsp. durum]|uniref:Peroxidase n=1 Tax=Triticum turgidum subsp. durum TaxID=4567 RepID=A0A9R1RJ44_TRITD|nr:unnamed protein product [Triticum turgidum subsp. durum]
MAKLAAALTVLALLGCMAREGQADYGHPSPPPHTPCSPGHPSTPPSTASPPPPASVPSPPASAELVVGYYQKTCHRAEDIVRETVRGANAGIMAGLVRLFFHDCFIRGCDASVLLDVADPSSATEKFGPPNLSLRGFEVIDAAKARIEKECGNVVSCADVLAFAGRDATYFLSTSDMDPKLMASLEKQCRSDTGSDNTVVQDIKTPNKLDNKYYKNVLSHEVLFASDAALLTADDTSAVVRANAEDNNVWEEKFKAAMVRMGAIEIKTSADGEIRRSCRVLNTY